MNNKPFISVVIPVYKVESYLSRCVESVRKQTYRNLEIILVDDGSPDGCPEICDSYAEQDERILVIHQKNQGLSAARNAGINAASGTYIGFVDSDDLIHPDMFRILIQICETQACEVAICGYQRFETIDELQFGQYSKIPKSSVFTSKQILTRIHSRIGALYTPAWNKLYRTELFKNIRYPVGKINEDEFTTYRLYDLASRIAVTNEPLYFYFRNANSITENVRYLENEDIYEAYEEQYRYFSKKGYQELLPLVRKSALDRVISRYRMANGRKNTQKRLKEKYHALYRESAGDHLGIGYRIFAVNPKLYFFLLKMKK